MKVLILGGVAAGTKVAAKLKRQDRSCEVTILTKSKNISYAGCGLPYYVGNVIKEKGELIVNTPEKFEALTGAAVKTGIEVIAVDRAAKTVTAKNVDTEATETISYDKLVIAVGASPIKPRIEGIDLPGVYYMRTPEDAFVLRDAIEAGEIKRAAVIGGGFIGIEIAENLTDQGVRTSVIELADHILPPFDTEIAEYIENHLADQSIMVFSGDGLQTIMGEGKVEKIKTTKRAMKVDAVIMSVGIRANTAFLKDTGIELMPNGTVKVNEYFQTNDENIYAIGDCATVVNFITGKPAWSPMGSSANIEGRLLAQTLTGAPKAYKGVVGTGVVKMPELNAGRTGLTEKDAIANGFDVVTVTTVVDDKAHYYPGSSNFIIKMIADKTTKRLLGIQVLGKGAVDKVVDIAATAIYMKATLNDLEDMDLAYAPPFSTAIHPFVTTVNILLNKISGNFETFTPAEYKAGAAEGYKVMDVCMQPTITSAPYVDLVKINGPVDGFDKDEKILLICNRGKRAYMTQNRLKFYGYTNTKVLEGGTIFNTIEG